MQATQAVCDGAASEAADWLSPAELEALTPAELVARTTALKPLLAAHARAAEEQRKPVDAVWAELRRTGAFYHFVPKRFGGLEFDLKTFIDAMLPLAQGCSSTAWVTAFCVEHNWMLAQFPLQAQAEIFGAFPYIVAPGVTTPPGKAVPVEGGYRLTGQWKWGTGVMHADWIIASGIVQVEGAAGGPPDVRLFVFPAAEARIVDTWHVDGMIATGSNDIAADGVFVPAHRCVQTARMRDGRAHGSEAHESWLYRMPMMPFLALTAAIPAVGTARAAVELFRTRLQEHLVYMTDQKQAEKPAAQMRLAHADLQARTAELLLRDAADRIQALAEAEAPPTPEQRVAIRAQLAHLMGMCRSAVNLTAEAAGSSAHQLANPIQRALRDINVMATHVVFDTDMATELHGRALIGLPMNSPLV